MQVTLVSDIHANLPALGAVLAAPAAAASDELWCTGDIVGYGPYPNEVIALLREHGAKAVVGNHDAAATGQLSTRDFNPAAAAANRWTARVLNAESKRWLSGLPRILDVEDPGGRTVATLVHGSLRDPLWEYLVTAESLAAQLESQPVPLSVFGHTHIPLVALSGPDGLQTHRPAPGEPVPLAPAPAGVNPGSVGQPRDRDPRAAFAILHFDLHSEVATYTLHRVEYDIAATQAAMRAAGLPAALIGRLRGGH